MAEEFRDSLIQQVQDGKLTPQEAEAQAARLGLGKLASEPAAQLFDPMGETWWTLHMTVAWIEWRTPEKVRTYWDKFRLECWDWRFRRWQIDPDGPGHSGYFLEPRRHASLWFMRREETGDDVETAIWPHQTAVAEAERKLWDALEEGSIEATGIEWFTQRRKVIPRLEWQDDLQIVYGPEGDHFEIRERTALSKGGYHHLAFRRSAVMARWPSPRPERTSERSLSLIKPEGGGYMPLCCAAYWIATKGGTETIDLRDGPTWEHAFSELLGRISSNEVAVTGIRAGERDKVPGHLFAGIQVDYSFGGRPLVLVFHDELYLYAGAYLDEAHWQRGFDDKLETRSGVKWTKLLVLKADVARSWPFAAPPASEDRDLCVLDRTGAPGRPSSMHFILIEYRDRRDRGEAQDGVAAEARALREWFVNAHPQAPPPSADTIENRIRDEHRERKARARN